MFGNKSDARSIGGVGFCYAYFGYGSYSSKKTEAIYLRSAIGKEQECHGIVETNWQRGFVGS